MRYFIPRFRIATLAPEQDRLLSKIGGQPWGLPHRLWPTCCGRPQKLLAQFCHEPPMLDLGAEGAVLHLFQCMECLGIGEERGRSAFIVDRSALGSGLSRVAGYDLPSEFGAGLIGEAWIDGWDQTDDGIPESRLAEFYDEKSLWAIQDEYSEIEWFDDRQMTRFGGLPRWTGNGPMNFPPPPFEFLFQLNNDLYFNGPPPAPDAVGCDVSMYTYVNGRPTDRLTEKPRPGNRRPNAPWGILHGQAENEFSFEYTNLGTDGRVYVFIDRTRQPHGAYWFWNR